MTGTPLVLHIQEFKKAGPLSFNCCFKGLVNMKENPLNLKTGGQAFTNLDSDQIYGRGNIGPSQCTIIPLSVLKDSLRKRILHTFGYQIPDTFIDNVDSPASQEFPYEQSQGQDTLQVCEFCQFSCRDRLTFLSHMKEHAVCDTCGKRYRGDDELANHIKAHTKVQCEECGINVQEDQLEAHHVNHENIS